MSLHIAKLFKNPLALAGVALVIHVGAATAADSKGDIQQQMREILAGTIAAHSAPQLRPPESNETSPTIDAQELTRRLILGSTGSSSTRAQTIAHAESAGASVKTEPRARPVAYGDAQAAARAVVLGQHEASEAAYLAARPTR